MDPSSITYTATAAEINSYVIWLPQSTIQIGYKARFGRTLIVSDPQRMHYRCDHFLSTGRIGYVFRRRWYQLHVASPNLKFVRLSQ